VIVLKGAAELPAAESSPEGLTVYVAAVAPAGARAKTAASIERNLRWVMPTVSAPEIRT
jgi:hypothetical protein